MIQSLYAGATGMESQQLNLNVISNNLANANTTAFKRSKAEFQDLLYQRPRQAGADAGAGNVLPTGVELGNGSRMVATAKIFTQGQLKQTGEKFDIAIQGDGFLQIQKVDGTFAYTRDGNLKIDQQGRFTTSDGLVVQSGFQPIPPGTTEVSIAPTGEVTARGPNGVVQFQAQLARFPNPSGLRAVGGNLYEDTIASGPFELGRPGLQGFGTMIQGYLETSNVNIVEEMVNMIQAQRAYELNSKSITTSDEMLGQVAQLKR